MQLESRRQFEDAGLAFSAAQDYSRALGAYRSCGDWRMCMVSAARQGLDPAAARALAAELVSEFRSGAFFQSAGELCLEVLGDSDNGVALLAQASCWKEALRASYGRGRPDLIETVVAPAAAEQAASTLEGLVGGRERVKKYMDRWRDVRRRREDMERALAAAEEEGGFTRELDEAQADAQSDVTSRVSALSMYTSATESAASTARSSSFAPPSTVGGRARQPKKGGAAGGKKGKKIRAGSENEERQLTDLIRQLAPTERALADLGHLCECLVQLGHEADARTLQLQATRLIEECEEAARELDADTPAPTHPSPLPPKQAAQWKWDILRAAARE